MPKSRFKPEQVTNSPLLFSERPPTGRQRGIKPTPAAGHLLPRVVAVAEFAGHSTSKPGINFMEVRRVR
ncbi:hypothetical protein CXR25_13925 [Brevibacterium aurantiacum]|nr:hypothetical protein CXR25_13925 [Brevibacterium aurantiacum]